MLSREECARLIKEYEACPSVRDNGMLSIDGFHAMFAGPEMDLFDPKCAKIYQDMMRPMSHYYIDSSHNT